VVLGLFTQVDEFDDHGLAKSDGVATGLEVLNGVCLRCIADTPRTKAICHRRCRGRTLGQPSFEEHRPCLADEISLWSRPKPRSQGFVGISRETQMPGKRGHQLGGQVAPIEPNSRHD
jgi:hypothetical protein